MQTLVLVGFIVGITIGGVVVWLFARNRSEELRRAISEARERENEAKTKANESDDRHAQTAQELKTALEDRGRYQSEPRVDEIKAILVGRDNEVKLLMVASRLLTARRPKLLRMPKLQVIGPKLWLPKNGRLSKP